MVNMTASTVSREASNYDEVSMQQSLLFSDSLKDLKNLRTQLYTAAEYFELSYTNDDQKQLVVETLKDYAIKALVNTVDHLGSVTFKVNDLLDEKVDEVTGTEFRVSCIEQRLRTCQEYIDHEGLSQQSLVINTPKYHKRYILPGNDTNLSFILGRRCKVPSALNQNTKDAALMMKTIGVSLAILLEQPLAKHHQLQKAKGFHHHLLHGFLSDLQHFRLPVQCLRKN
ncbi:Protein ABIL3 [Linum perenne]